MQDHAIPHAVALPVPSVLSVQTHPVAGRAFPHSRALLAPCLLMSMSFGQGTTSARLAGLMLTLALVRKKSLRGTEGHHFRVLSFQVNGNAMNGDRSGA